MNLLTIGISHHTAPQDLRARFAFTLDQLQPSLKGLAQRWLRDTQHPEVALLSTCNRTELYCASPGELRRPAVEWLAGVGGLTARQLMEHAYVLEGPAAARHAFRVASGLDSMVLGEPHILGQMKRAMREAEQAGTMGSTLHQLFQRALFVAKAVRSQTGLGQHAVGYAAACAGLAQETFGGLAGCAVLYLGAGEMVENVALQLQGLQPRAISVANRSLQRGRALAGRLGGQALALADLPSHLGRHDLVVACTASQVPLVTPAMVRQAVQERAAGGQCCWWTWACRATSRRRWATRTVCGWCPWTNWAPGLRPWEAAGWPPCSVRTSWWSRGCASSMPGAPSAARCR